ncbi:MAG: polysaccharide biosynthesis tyrosine autokinase [Gemmataceae bacterium]|nr:polysaccharide biosynthesis tyrosine autokinase [Gemmataceae bacterium]
MHPVEPNKPLVPQGANSNVGDSVIVRTGFLTPAVAPQPAAHDPKGKPPPGLAGTLTFSGLLQALRRRWLLATSGAIAAAALAVAAVLLLMPAKYTAQVRIHVASRGEGRVFVEGGHDEPEFVIVKANMAAMVKSPLILYAALGQRTSAGKEVKDLALVRDHGVDWLENALKTDFLIGPEILKVYLSGDRSDEVAEVLNAVAKAFIEENSGKEKARRTELIKQLNDNKSKMEADLQNLRNQLRALEKQYGIEDFNVRQAQYQAALVKQGVAEKDVFTNRVEQIKAKEEISNLKERIANVGKMTVTAEKVEESFRQDPRSQGVVLELQKVEKDIFDTRSTANPILVDSLVQPFEKRKAEVQESMVKLKEALRPELEKRWREKYADEMNDRMVKHQEAQSSLEKQESIMKSELTKIQQEVAKLAPTNLPPDVLRQRERIDTMETSLRTVGSKIQVMSAEVVNPRVSILQLAGEPRERDYNRQIKLAGGGGFSLFFLVLFGVAYFEFRARKVSGADEIQQGLGIQVVGSLPAIPAGARSSQSGASAQPNAPWQYRLYEAVDAIRTMLMHASRNDNLRVIMVTSASSGEGKTSLASQLAASLARAWRKTLLIDGDLRHPASHHVFGLPQEPGFSDVLRNEVGPNEAIKPTPLSRLWLMPAGQFDSHAVQALAQDDVRTLLEQLKQQYDFIIVDSCPVLPVADSLLLGQHVDGVIFAVLRDVSRVPSVYAAQQKLQNLGIRTLGAVMIGAPNELGKLGYKYTAVK